MEAFRELCKLALDRDIGELTYCPAGMQRVALGESGTKKTPGVDMHLGAPDWVWPRHNIPCEDGSVGVFHAYHFFEHLSGLDAINLLKECERKLCTYGIIQYGIPYAGTELAYQDLTHKSNWTATTFSTLFENKYYDPTEGHDWKLKVTAQAIVGVSDRNRMIVGQLVKMPNGTNDYLGNVKRMIR